MNMNSLKSGLLLTACALAAAGCAPQTTSKEKEQIRNKNSEEVGDAGGEVAIDDGSKITVPPGAVAIGTDVSVQKVADDPVFAVGTESASSTVEIKATGQDGVALEQAAQPMTVALAIESGASLYLTGSADDMCVLLKTISGKQMVWRRNLLTIDEAAKKVSLQSLYFGKYKAVYCGVQEIAGFEDAGDTGATGAPPIEIAMTVPSDFAPEISRGKYCIAVIRGNKEDGCSKEANAPNPCEKSAVTAIAVAEAQGSSSDTELKISVNSASITDGFEYYLGVSFLDASASCPMTVGKSVDETGPGDVRAFYAFKLEPSAIKDGVSGALGAGDPYRLEPLTLKIGGEGTFANLPAHDEATVCIDVDGKGGKTMIPAVFAGGKINGQQEFKTLAASPSGLAFDRVTVRPGAKCNTFDTNFATADALTGKPYELTYSIAPNGSMLMTPITMTLKPSSLTAAALSGKKGCVSIFRPGTTGQNDNDWLGQMTVSFSQATPYKLYLPYLSGSGVPKYDFQVVALQTGGCENVQDSTQYIIPPVKQGGKELNANIEVQL